MNHSKPTLTVFADASVYHDHKVAGWAGFARLDDQKPMWFSGPARFDTNVAVVELQALQEMLARLFPGEHPADLTHMLLQSDSLHGLEMLWYALKNGWPAGQSDAKLKSRRTPTEAAWTQINKMLPLLACRQVVYLKHVKGHQNGVHARSWVNERCDQMAKKAARAQIQKVKS